MEWIIDHPTSLLDALKKRYPDSSSNTLRQWIQHRRIAVDDIQVSLPKQMLQQGQRISLLPSNAPTPGREENLATVLYEDRYLVVVDKRAGALSVATTTEIANTVHAELKRRYHPQKIFVIHRLDQGTSGLMIFAREQGVFHQLKDQLAAHDIDRRYLAIVKGIPSSAEGVWRSYLWEDGYYHVHSTEDPKGGEEAITHYLTVAQWKEFALLQLTLETGKKNQIRVHCQRAGIPVVGDDKYGGDRSALSRLALHAYSLHFTHPKTEQPMTFYSPVPFCFSRLIPPKLWVQPPITLAKKSHA